MRVKDECRNILLVSSVSVVLVLKLFSWEQVYTLYSSLPFSPTSESAHTLFNTCAIFPLRY